MHVYRINCTIGILRESLLNPPVRPWPISRGLHGQRSPEIYLGSQSSTSDARFLEIVEHPDSSLRKSSSGASLSSQVSLNLSRSRPESAGSKKPEPNTPRKATSQNSLLLINAETAAPLTGQPIDQSSNQLTRNQPHHRPRLDLHDTANQRFVSRWISTHDKFNDFKKNEITHFVYRLKICYPY